MIFLSLRYGPHGLSRCIGKCVCELIECASNSYIQFSENYEYSRIFMIAERMHFERWRKRWEENQRELCVCDSIPSPMWEHLSFMRGSFVCRIRSIWAFYSRRFYDFQRKLIHKLFYTRMVCLIAQREHRLPECVLPPFHCTIIFFLMRATWFSSSTMLNEYFFNNCSVIDGAGTIY